MEGWKRIFNKPDSGSADKGWEKGLVEVSFSGRYFSRRKTRKMLERLFPNVPYQVQEFGGQWIFRLPRELTKDEFNQIEDYAIVDEEDEGVEDFSWDLDETAATSHGPKLQTHVPNTSSGPQRASQKSGVEKGESKKRNRLSELPLIQSYRDGELVLPAIPELGQEKRQGEDVDQLYILKKQEEHQNGQSGFLYEKLVSQGQTSRVFKVNAAMAWRSDIGGGYSEGATSKVAVKRLETETSHKQFFHEYDSLRRINQLHHPNIVQICAAFRNEQNGLQYFNFLFPLAIGNVKQLVRGSLDLHACIKWKTSLWSEFEGLASGLEYLHDKCQIAHRDIKPSNILLYEECTDTDYPRLSAKLADFGLAADLENAVVWQLGTVEAKSAWRYDAPEVRSLVEIPGDKENQEYSPTPEQLCANDIWKLGAVFSELLTFLLHGSQGVSEFRTFITTTYKRLTSDGISDTRFDDGEKVKEEVLVWLRNLAAQTHQAGEVVPITIQMLDEASRRPSAAFLRGYLLQTSTAMFSDGERLVRFDNHDSIPKPNLYDLFRSWTEQKLCAPVDWWPLSPLEYKCPPGHTRIHWKWSNQSLSIDLSDTVVSSYKVNHCRPVSTVATGPSHLPFYNSNPSQSTSAANQVQNQRGTSQHPPGQRQQTAHSSAQPPIHGTGTITGSTTPAGSVSEIYWCVDLPWAEPKETHLRIQNARDLSNDKGLCEKLRNEYRQIRGFRGRFLSWKTCLGIKFVRFHRIFHGDKQVACLVIELPKNPPYEYSQIHPEAVHMAIASKQIIAGMYDPSRINGGSTLNLIPKKQDSQLAKDMGAEGWGLHAVQGWSLRKILYWTFGFNFVGFVFVVWWLVYIDKKDLQNAFVPATFLTTILCLAMGVPQYLDAT